MNCEKHEKKLNHNNIQLGHQQSPTIDRCFFAYHDW